MKGSYCYLPILKARTGAFDAVRALSPEARSRLAPLFDIQPPTAKQGSNLPLYLSKKIDGITSCWTRDRPVYVDAHSFPVETSVHGRTPAEFVCEGIRANGFRCIPVTGLESERGRDYVRITASVARKFGNGICLRIERDDIASPTLLNDSLRKTVDLVSDPVDEIDLLLDLEFVGKDSAAEIHSTLLEALQVAESIGTFRNVIVAGGSVPEQLPKSDTGIVRRERRVEMEAWTKLQTLSGAAIPIIFSDFGVINPRYVKPGKAVNVPARVRYTTTREHVLLRSGRSGHSDLCREMIGLEDYSGAAFSAGDQRMSLAANGLANPGNPGVWIAGDLNHHLELVSAQVWATIYENGLSSRYSLPDPQRIPWLQTALIAE